MHKGVRQNPAPTKPGEHQRLYVTIQGTVQGVGFRPFVYRLATSLGLGGYVLNSRQGVTIEVEGSPERLAAFLHSLQHDKPPLATIYSLQTAYLDPIGYQEFEIRHSENAEGEAFALILPDLATCKACQRELFDPTDRRYRYPFINCTNCGPRFSIILGLPYDRPQTTMRKFVMCAACQREYDDPADRRFHAQPNACPACGPHLELWAPSGEIIATHEEAFRQAEKALREGQIVALKGLGGFHLLVDARDEAAVQRLRARKRREEKPLAIMMPTLAAVQEACFVSEAEALLLGAPQAPIVLLKRRAKAEIAPSVAPDNPYLGVMLPYTPLHHLLLADLGFPLVATSGNVSDEPICTDEKEALQRLHGIADLFLVHNRPIARHVDDSVVRIVGGRPLILRRARGYAPLPVPLAALVGDTAANKESSSRVVLAVGAHLKNVTALGLRGSAFLSQHIGDLETAAALAAFRRVAKELPTLYKAAPEQLICDLHPDYLSTQEAKASGLPCVPVQHHVAHVLSCMAENALPGPVLGLAWDGSGYGADGTIWGGEAFLVGQQIRHLAHFRPFPLPGGEKAIKEPRRAALGALFELYGEKAFALELPPLTAFTNGELRVLRQMLRQGVNAPKASSVGRLFDAVAALLGLRQCVAFEGQAAMALEYLLDGVETEEAYSFRLQEAGPLLVVDWGPILEAIQADLQAGEPAVQISARFHNALAEIAIALAKHFGEEKIVLSGGCFQNKYLTERIILLAKRAGLKAYWHQNVPPNDGGIALGQLCYFYRYGQT